MKGKYLKQGLRDGIPICFGYFAVSFAFGILAVESGCSIFESVLISFTNLTSAGQFAGLTVIAQAGTLLEMALTQLVINARYMLMSIALSQKVDSGFRGIWRWILGFGITDEIFAAAIQRDEPIAKSYFGGLMFLPLILGWTSGTFFGAFLGNVLPEILTNALGIALYGMFIAVVVPKSVEDKQACPQWCCWPLPSASCSNMFRYLRGFPVDLLSLSVRLSPRQPVQCCFRWRRKSEWIL